MKHAIVALALLALSGCGAETVTTAATSTAIKQQEAEQGKKTMEQAQQKVEQATQLMQQRAQQPGTDAAGK